ncbi:hypothetical protein CYY_001273 [Polysphondylium violaceum]|uniref:PIPK domain-containing protein n=1 Tax=Polysphondylium violaceum TaxID=133409 RepID=A0A8J4Q3I8_9MYCE|nr:hypothetical protein CYY_001273 [Polysphondylium violaceum]
MSNKTTTTTTTTTANISPSKLSSSPSPTFKNIPNSLHHQHLRDTMHIDSEEETFSSTTSFDSDEEKPDDKFKQMRLRKNDSISRFRSKNLVKGFNQRNKGTDDNTSNDVDDDEEEEEEEEYSRNSKQINEHQLTPPPVRLSETASNMMSTHSPNGDSSSSSTPSPILSSYHGTPPPTPPLSAASTANNASTTTTTTTTTTSSTTPTTNTCNNSNASVPSIVVPPSSIQENNKKNNKQIIDSDDEEFGYDDNIKFCLVRKRSPSADLLKPINNPIPKRPVLQVDPSQELIYISLIALRTSLRIGSEPVSILTQSQFEHVKKYKVSISEKRSVIKDFSPNVFNILRNRLNIDQTEFLKSWSSFLTNDEKKKSISSDNFTIYSTDKKYIMKTISKSDSVKFRKLLPHYYNYIIYNPNSYLEKYLGLFRVGNKSSHSYVVILVNVQCHCNNSNESFLYNGLAKEPIKTVNRNNSTHNVNNSHSNQKQQQQQQQQQQKKIKSINIEKNIKANIFRQIEKDTTFLCSQEIADYSLIVNCGQVKKETLANESNLLNSVDFNLSISTSTSPNGSDVGSPRYHSEPIKLIPRLLYFIEDVENVTKSNNLKISKSLKKSFSTLPRSWSLEDIREDASSVSSSSPNQSPKLIHSNPNIPNSRPSSPISHGASFNNNYNNSNNNNTGNNNFGMRYQGGHLSQGAESSDNHHEIYFIGIVDFVSSSQKVKDNKKKITSIAKIPQSIGANSNQYLKRFLVNIKEIF